MGVGHECFFEEQSINMSLQTDTAMKLRKHTVT